MIPLLSAQIQAESPEKLRGATSIFSAVLSRGKLGECSAAEKPSAKIGSLPLFFRRFIRLRNLLLSVRSTFRVKN